MVSVSHVVKKLLDNKVFIQEGLSRGIISYGALARQLKSEVEQELGKEVKTHAIVMALKRYAEEVKRVNGELYFDERTDITLKTHICEISVSRSSTLPETIKKLYEIVDFEAGDFLDITEGKHEVSILTNERYADKMIKLLKNEKITNVENNLVLLTLTCPKEFQHKPGIIFNVTRSIAWENINIYKIASTNREITLILDKKDAIKGYKAMEKLISNNGKNKPKV